MSVDVLNTIFAWTDRENGTQLDVPIDYEVEELNNTPGIRTAIGANTILTDKTFVGFDADIRVFMSEPVEFVQLSFTANGNVGSIDLPYLGLAGTQHMYAVDDKVLFDGGVSVPVGTASAVVELATSAYPSQSILPVAFEVNRLALDESAAPPSGCFWTDVVGATQDCGGEDPQPPADFIFFDTVVTGSTVQMVTPWGDDKFVLVTQFEVRIYDFSEGGPADPLVAAVNFGNSTKAAYIAGNAFYWFGVDFGTNPNGDLQCVTMPADDVLGMFDVYSGPRTVINSVVGYGSLSAVAGAMPDPGSNAGLLLIRDGSTQQDILFTATAGGPADGWTSVGAAPNTLSDRKFTYDPQLGAPLLTANNGVAGSGYVWWAYKVTAGGWELLQEAANQDIAYNTEVQWSAGLGKFVGIIGDVGRMINSDGSLTNFPGIAQPYALYPYQNDSVFYVQSHSCEGTPDLAKILNLDGSVKLDTDVDFAYMGVDVYLALPAIKMVIGRMTNQCI